MRKWNRTRDILPKEHVIVETKIDDGNGCRNQQNLYQYGNLWFFPDGSSLVICEYHHWLEWKEKWSDENTDSVGTREYLLKPGYHYLADCRSSRTAMIEKLKEV